MKNIQRFDLVTNTKLNLIYFETAQAMVALKQQIEELRGALNYIVSNEFESSISPSNKKFIKVRY